MEKQEQLNVVIVDDNPMVLSTLDEMINAEDGLTVIGKADNGEDAIDMIKDTTPDIVLLDMVMPKSRRGLQLLRNSITETRFASILFLSCSVLPEVSWLRRKRFRPE